MRCSEKSVVSLEDLSTQLPEEVYEMVVKVQETGDELTTATNEVALIKLAERLHNMRTVDFMDEKIQREKAKETIEIFMPLASKIGNQKLMDELNDLSMKYYAE